MHLLWGGILETAVVTSLLANVLLLACELVAMCEFEPSNGRGPWGAIIRALYDAVMSERLLGHVRSFQTACGVVPRNGGTPSNPVIHAVFAAASTLGDEAFYTVALPLCAWVLDLELCRRLAFFWASTYYVGQSAKEILRLPRPPAPVLRLEHQYSAEYGLPSTHTMGSLIPLFLLALRFYGSGLSGTVSGVSALTTDSRIPAALLWPCLAWSAVIAASRLYMGVHSIPDVLAGYILGGGLFAFWLTFGSGVDAFIVGNSLSWLAILVGAGAAILLYPRPERWTNSYGDTAIIIATAAGFLEGCCLLEKRGTEAGDVTLQVLQGVHLLSSGRAESYGWGALAGDARRCGAGFLVLLPMRSALKYCCRGALSALLARSLGWPKNEASRRHCVDIPAKLVVYGCMGFSSCVLVPKLWVWLGIQEDRG